jgi:hypothetical protein
MTRTLTPGDGGSSATIPTAALLLGLLVLLGGALVALVFIYRRIAARFRFSPALKTAKEAVAANVNLIGCPGCKGDGSSTHLVITHILPLRAQREPKKLFSTSSAQSSAAGLHWAQSHSLAADGTGRSPR